MSALTLQRIHQADQISVLIMLLVICLSTQLTCAGELILLNAPVLVFA